MYGGNKMTESKKIRFIIPLFLIFLMVFSACGNQNEEASSNSNRTDSNSVANNGSNTNDETNSEVEAQVITVAHQQPETHPVNISFTEKLEPMIEENSNGQLKVEIYGGAQLGGERDVMEQTQANQVQITHISPVLGSIYPPVNLTDLPYLFKDFDHVDSVLEGELGQQILEGMAEETGLRGMAFIDNGFRQITNNVREINSLSDLEGLKIRVPEAPISIENLSALGANVETISYDELYSALQQGVVDGQENAYTTAASGKFYEVQKYVAETRHMYGQNVILVNDQWFTNLSAELQEVVTEAIKETARYHNELHRGQEEENKQLLVDNGMILTEPDLTEFREASEVVYEKFYEENPDLKDLVEEIRSYGE